MDANKRALNAELAKTLNQINQVLENQIEALGKQIMTFPYPETASPYSMTDRDGKPVLTDILCAKAEVLSAMARLREEK